MRVLVTGGLGYLGSHVAHAFMAAGHEVVTLDKSEPGVRRGLFDGEGFVRADLLRMEDSAADLARLAPVDAIVHFAALIDARESVAEPVLYYRANLGATLSALELAQRLGARRFIFASSAAVYGPNAKLPVREAEADVTPENPYGGTKLAGERMVADICRATGLDSLSLRMFNLVGGDARVGVVPRGGGLFAAVTQTMAGLRERVLIYGGEHPTKDGTASRDFVDVRDVAQAYVLALQRSDWGHGAVNIGSGAPTTVMEVIGAARRIVGDDAVKTQVCPPRIGELSQSLACVGLAEEIIGWRPQPTDLQQALGYEYRIRRCA